ncbi:MAG: hypothetical protein OXG58_10280 [Gemmatimonadetes bacterium]|nr:hypothetical protein [Gemmatimonadota bacterium]
MDRFDSCRQALAALCVLCTAACAEREPDAAIRIDSAGVQIVQSTSAAWLPGDEWYVAPEPVVRLGNVEDDHSSHFFRILDVALLADGDVIVVDGGSSEVRRYDATGRHLWSAGGTGDGPGEFWSQRYLGRRDDGAFLIWDRSLSRLSVVGESGQLIATERRSFGGSAIVAQAVFDDGTWLVTFPATLSAPEAGVAWLDTIALWRYDPAWENRVRLARIVGGRWIWTGRHMLPVPFSPRPLWATYGTRLAVATGPDAEVSVHDVDGSLVTRYRIARDRRAVAESEVTRVIESLVELGQSGAGAAVWRDWRDRIEVPRYEPAFDRLLADRDGTFWARRFESDPLSREPPTWDVLDPTGVYLGSVSTPGGLTVLSIRDGLLAGVYRDELGVEYVRVHRVVRRKR